MHSFSMLRISSGSNALIGRVRAVLVAVCVWSVAFACGASPVLADAAVPSGPMTYRQSVQLALNHSPYFVPSGLEIKVKRLDLWDQRMQLLPDFFVNTSIRLNNPDNRDSDALSVSFSFGDYDPLRAYFSIGAYELMVQRSILEHIETIDEGLYSLAQIYLGMDVWNRASIIHDEIIETARQQKAFATQRFNAGFGSTLDVMLADRHMQDAINQKRKNETAHLRSQARMKNFLGIPEEQALVLDLEDASGQVIGNFDPNEVTYAQAQRDNLELQKKNLDRQLQRYQVRLAYAKFLPKYSLGIAREYSANNDSDVYLASIGLTIPVWDWGERYRGVVRERRRSGQAAAKERIAALDLKHTFRETQGACLDSAEDLKLMANAAEIASLERQRAEIMYRSGSIEYHKFNAAVERDLEARLALLTTEYAYDQVVLKLRYLSGNLHSSFLDVATFDYE